MGMLSRKGSEVLQIMYSVVLELQIAPAVASKMRDHAQGSTRAQQEPAAPSRTLTMRMGAPIYITFLPLAGGLDTYNIISKTTRNGAARGESSPFES